MDVHLMFCNKGLTHAGLINTNAINGKIRGIFMDTTNYLITFEKFLNTMEGLPNSILSGTQNALEDICQILGIGRITVDFYENKRSVLATKLAILYTCADYNEQAYTATKHVTRNGDIAIYKVYRTPNAEQSTEIDKRIELLLKMIYVFNGRSQLLKRIDALTYYDQELPFHNLAYYMKYLHAMIDSHTISCYTAIHFNLKRFSVVNERLGRSTGTKVMEEYIKHIASLLDEDELVCRIGGDNFTLLIHKDHLPSILSVLEGYGVIFNKEPDERIKISAAAGIYSIPENVPVTAANIMDRITSASRTARTVLENDFVYYDDKMIAKQEHMIKIESLLPNAFANEEFLVYYQPKISLDNYNLIGAEALCRWRRNGRILPPEEFIPVFEQSMEICKLDFYMLDHVCKDIRRWLDAGKRVVRVSVNMSRRHLSDMDLLTHVMDIIDGNHVPHEYIEIELTESTTDVEFCDLKKFVNGLQNLGISTSVDDFGIGYSSLTLIKDIPWNVIKLDRSFLPQESLDVDDHKRVMFKHVIAMAQELGLECITEGVESEEHLHLLKEHSCNFAQGFYFDKPLPMPEFEERLEHYNYK